MQLSNKVAVVVGGTFGIGKEIALGFANAGAIVIAASRSAERVQQMEALLRGLGNQGCGLVLDISSRTDIPNFMEAVAERYGRIDILVNSAG